MDEHSTEAYIFDPGVIARNVAGRDLAVLEVSALLHQRIDFDTLFRICSVLYSSDALGEEAVKAIRDPAGKAILSFIRGLREAALGGNDLEVYALMVFDFTLIQVGGLAFGSSGNRIADPRSAVYLLAVVAKWYQDLRRLGWHPGQAGLAGQIVPEGRPAFS